MTQAFCRGSPKSMGIARVRDNDGAYASLNCALGTFSWVTAAFPWNDAPRYLIRDRDCVYGDIVTRRLRTMGIRDKPIAPGEPWQNGIAERSIGSIRRAEDRRVPKSTRFGCSRS